MTRSTENRSSSIYKYKYLQKLKLSATLILVVLLVLLVILEDFHGVPYESALKAFVVAAIVGGMADWFAVVALFRHPLGLPIPHTAVIPRNKSKIADNVSDFVVKEFLMEELVVKKFIDSDPTLQASYIVKNMMGKHENVSRLANVLLSFIDFISKSEFNYSINKIVLQSIRNWKAAKTTGNVLHFLTKEGRHTELLSLILGYLANYIGSEEFKSIIKSLIKNYYREKTNMLIRGLYGSEYVSNQATEAISTKIISITKEILEDSSHPIRVKYDDFFKNMVVRLRGDRELEDKINSFKENILESEEVQGYILSLFNDTVDIIKNDLSNYRSSKVVNSIIDFLYSGIKMVEEDASLRQRINSAIKPFLHDALGKLQNFAVTHIRSTINNWNEEELVETLEINIGADLQFIRFNGVAVGGIIGLAIYLVGVVSRVHL